MASDPRQTGGLNNKKGNRYEDAFAVCRCLELAPAALAGVRVSFSEQADCPVDDLLIREGDRRHYHQLKNHAAITWGGDGGKLRREFADQRQRCQDAGEDHTLNLVVAHDHRKRSCDDAMPAELTGAVAVRHFPETWPPSKLALLDELREVLSEISASHYASQELFEGLAAGFHQAWVEAIPGDDGASLLGDIVHYVQSQPPYRMRLPVPAVIHPRWAEVEVLLSQIPGLVWHTDRGHFEWECGFDRGLYRHIPGGTDFDHFVGRILADPPANFDDFEVLLL